MCPSHITLVKSSQDVSDRKNGKAKKPPYVPPPGKGMKFMNELLPAHFKSRKKTNDFSSNKLKNTKKTIERLSDDDILKKCEELLKRLDEAERKQRNDHEVPIALFLTFTALRQLEDARWKETGKKVPIGKMDFSDSVTEWDLPIFSGHYYSTPAALITQICNYAHNHLDLPLYDMDKMRRFLSLIRDDTKRNKAAEQVKKEFGTLPEKADEQQPLPQANQPV